MLQSLRTLYTTFRSGFTNLHSHEKYTSFSVSSQHLSLFSYWKNSLMYSVSFPKFLLQVPYFPPIPSHPLTFLSLFGFVQLLLRVGRALACGPPHWLFFSQHLSDANSSSASGGIPCIFCLYWLFYTWPRRAYSRYYSLFSFPVQQTTSLRSDVVVFHGL